MIRGTTAQFKFKLPCTKGELKDATITFWQPNNLHENLPIIKYLVHCNAPDDSSEICVALTAEETAYFLDTYKAKVQISAIRNSDGTVFASRPQVVTVYPMNDKLLEEVLKSN